MEYKKSIVSGRKKLKTLLVRLVFWFLGRGAQAVARLDGKVAGEVGVWEDGTTVMLKVEPCGPAMSMGKRGGRLLYLGSLEAEADLIIYFKNIEAALLVLLGSIGIDRAFAEQRFMLKGDIAVGMSLVRSLNMVEAYLFPCFITRRILKRMPVRERSRLRIYAAVLLGI